MRLKSVSIAGFRSVALVEGFAIGQPTLITGHNDAGKSAILDAVRFLLGDYTPTHRDLTFVDEEDRDSASESPRVDELEVIGEFDLSVAESTELELPRTVRIRRRFAPGAAPPYEIELQVPTNDRLRELDALVVADLKELVKEFAIETDARLKAEYLAAVRKYACTVDQAPMWTSAGSAIIKALPAIERFDMNGAHEADEAIRKALDTAFRAHISGEDHRGGVRELEEAISAQLVEDASEIRKHIMSRCADIGDVRIVPVVSFSEGLRSTQVTVVSEAGDGSVGLAESGAGRARRVSLAVWEFTTGLLANAGDVVMVYDEPDTHLDYAHQREFMDIVRSQCDLTNVAMVIATHSMNLIDGIDIADVVHVSHDEHRRTRIGVLTDDSNVGQHLGAIASALGLRNTVLLHERLFVGVEGPTETACFPVLFRLATGRQLESAGIALWACRNNEGALDFATFLVSHERNVVFVVDEDSRSNSRHVFSDEKLARRGLDPNRHAIYIGEPRELEELFDDSLWCRAANQSWPRTDGREWAPEDFTQHRESKFSSEVLEMAKVASETGPSSKPDAMITLALSLTTLDEVPEPLRVIFDELVKRAS
jgi:putative ATP-dependent endonuclease of OLD family